MFWKDWPAFKMYQPHISYNVLDEKVMVTRVHKLLKWTLRWSGQRGTIEWKSLARGVGLRKKILLYELQESLSNLDSEFQDEARKVASTNTLFQALWQTETTGEA